MTFLNVNFLRAFQMFLSCFNLILGHDARIAPSNSVKTDSKTS